MCHFVCSFWNSIHIVLFQLMRFYDLYLCTPKGGRIVMLSRECWCSSWIKGMFNHEGQCSLCFYMNAHAPFEWNSCLIVNANARYAFIWMPRLILNEINALSWMSTLALNDINARYAFIWMPMLLFNEINAFSRIRMLKMNELYI